MKERCDMLEERNTDTGFRCHVRNVGGRGKPRFVVSKNQVQGLKDLGFSWTKISTMIGVSRTTLHRRRQELGLNNCNNYSEIDNEELDVFVRFILEQTPEAGEVMVRGALRGRGISVQRWRLRDSIQRVDPVRKQYRQRLRIRRRVYNVPGPNSLWYVAFFGYKGQVSIYLFFCKKIYLTLGADFFCSLNRMDISSRAVKCIWAGLNTNKVTN